ncbi:glycosyltransferase family 25 protein [Pusillimonas minor]|uniref:Glycosyltransferase family 25 protein n=1 Tax=Pusillimonas minor TaxID=2697024 RepID=A0A842HQS3_9BURK|nr:glycosyltransferase family 25 protein [Pusillimonas minor]MBC2770623.1 glycosyltransferase family 25 protein [Pusillimonas minor]
MSYQLPCFVLSSSDEAAHREPIRARLEAKGLRVTFFPMVERGNITERNLGSYVNAQKNKSEYGDVLTPTNVSVALSHLNVYRHILNHHLPGAVILEEDADVSDALVQLLDTKSGESLEHLFGSYEPVVVQLTHVAQAYRSQRRDIGSTPFKMMRPYGTVRQSRGYFITNAACHNLVKTQYPVWTSADHWEGFVEQDIFRLWALTPNPVWACDPAAETAPINQPVARPTKLLAPVHRVWDKVVTENILVRRLPKHPPVR